MTAKLKISLSMCRTTALTRGSVESIANTFSEQKQATWCISDQAAMLVVWRITEVKEGFDVVLKGKDKYIYRLVQ